MFPRPIDPGMCPARAARWTIAKFRLAVEPLPREARVAARVRRSPGRSRSRGGLRRENSGRRSRSSACQAFRRVRALVGFRAITGWSDGRDRRRDGVPKKLEAIMGAPRPRAPCPGQGFPCRSAVAQAPVRSPPSDVNETASWKQRALLTRSERRPRRHGLVIFFPARGKTPRRGGVCGCMAAKLRASWIGPPMKRAEDAPHTSTKKRTQFKAQSWR